MSHNSLNQFSNPNLVKYCTNSFEQQKLIDQRLANLINCLNVAENIRHQTDMSRKKLKENLSESYELLNINLNRIENKTYAKIDQSLLQKQIDIPIRSLEKEVHQLIENLNRFSMLNDAEKLLILKNIDTAIKQIEHKLDCIEKYKKYELDSLVEGNKAQLNNMLKNQLDRIEKFLAKENLNLNTLVMLNEENSSNEPDYKKWLLKTTDSSNYRDQRIQEEKFYEFIDIDFEQELKQARRNSFDFIDMNNELESINILTEFDNGDYKNWLVKPQTTNIKNSKSNEIKRSDNDGVSHIFRDIYSKPMDYWLLKKH